jgi:hypothetical protein
MGSMGGKGIIGGSIGGKGGSIGGKGWMWNN